MVTLILLNQQSKCLFLEHFYDYFWREYNGEIPNDAIIGGISSNGDNIYIGQAYVHNYGLIPGQIRPKIDEIVAIEYGIHRTTKYNKVCFFKE